MTPRSGATAKAGAIERSDVEALQSLAEAITGRASMKKIRMTCPCGETIVADDEDELVENANRHLEDRHPELVGVYTREHILALAF